MNRLKQTNWSFKFNDWQVSSYYNFSFIFKISYTAVVSFYLWTGGLTTGFVYWLVDWPHDLCVDWWTGHRICVLIGGLFTGFVCWLVDWPQDLCVDWWTGHRITTKLLDSFDETPRNYCIAHTWEWINHDALPVEPCRTVINLDTRVTFSLTCARKWYV